MASSTYNLRPMPRQGFWVTLRSLNEVLGDEGYKQVLARAGLPAVYLNLAGQGREWPEATFNMSGSVNRAVLDLHPNDGAALLIAAGRAQFRHARENLPMHINMLSSMLKALPRDVRMKMVLEQGARDLQRSSNALPVVTADATTLYVTDTAPPTCAGQTSKTPMCFTRIGLLVAAMEWATESTGVKVTEVECMAVGARHCRFAIPKKF